MPVVSHINSCHSPAQYRWSLYCNLIILAWPIRAWPAHVISRLAHSVKCPTGPCQAHAKPPRRSWPYKLPPVITVNTHTGSADQRLRIAPGLVVDVLGFMAGAKRMGPRCLLVGSGNYLKLDGLVFLYMAVAFPVWVDACVVQLTFYYSLGLCHSLAITFFIFIFYSSFFFFLKKKQFDSYSLLKSFKSAVLSLLSYLIE